MSAHWTERPEGGGRFALKLIFAIALRGGRRLTRLILLPITLYFFLRRGPERRASREFLSRVLQRPASAWDVLRHLHRFAAVILDRVYLLATDCSQFEMHRHGLEGILEKYYEGRGLLMLGAHIGSFEVLRVLSLERPDVKVKVLLDKSQTPEMTDLLHSLNPKIGDTVIDAAEGGTGVVLALKDATEQGALIAFLADRARPHEPTRDVQFLGRPAPLPVAPYLIASALDVPVVLCFGMYRGGNRYDLYFETFAERIDIPRAERQVRLQFWLDAYAARLEHYARMDPYNWFNFYDFWKSNRLADTEPAAVQPRSV